MRNPGKHSGTQWRTSPTCRPDAPDTIVRKPGRRVAAIASVMVHVTEALHGKAACQRRRCPIATASCD